MELEPGAGPVTALCHAPQQGAGGASHEDPRRQTPTRGDLEMGHPLAPAESLPGLEQSSPLPALETGPAAQPQTLRDFERHLNDLKKENFSLKLRIYFLEERVQQKHAASREDVYTRNIELKVTVESLKRELQEKQQALDQAWAAAESVSSCNEAELRRRMEERQQETEHVAELLENKIQRLQEEARLAKREAEQAAALAEAERGRCQELSEKLQALTGREEKGGAQAVCGDPGAALAHKDKRIEELSRELSARGQLIELLAADKQNLLQRLEGPGEMEVQNLLEDHEQPTQSDPAASGRVSELQGSIQQYEATTKLLQEKLDELNFELNSVQEASQRQERMIQSLNEALRSRERETEELYQVIDGQNEAMAKLRDTLQRSQLGHLQASESPSPSQQQLALLDLQNTLFCTQLEVQKLQRAQRQKEHQLAEARRATQLLEAAVQEEQQLKEVSWKHNQELRKSVQQAQAELQGKAQQLQTLEGERCREIRAQEQCIQHLSQRLAHKEQLLQESRELLQHWQSAEKSPAGTDAMLEKLQQRIRDRDAALERGIDERFCALEEKERELQRLHLCVREREHDLQRLHGVLSSNEATMQSMESLLKAKTLELEQASAACQSLQWLKEEVEAKSSCWQKEQEGVMQQLQTSLHDRNKDVEELTATLLRKLGPGQREVVEELCMRLQRKERLLQDLLSDRSRQAGEHEAELGELFRAMSAQEQRSQVAAGKLVQALAEKNNEVQFLRRQLAGKEPGKSPAAEDKQPFQERLPRGGGDVTATRIPMGEDSKDRAEKGLGEMAAELEKELASARDDLALMARKERESRVEVSALRSAVAAQEKELQVQASDIESLSRSVQSKEDLIKDLQMQLVDPEEVPAMERLTQEVLVLREKVAMAETRGQEAAGSRRQQLMLMLEGLVAERSRLNEALQAERQLYSSLVKSHAPPDSPEQGQSLRVELERAQALRGRLEEALGRSMERLRRLETLGAFGGRGAEDAGAGSTEWGALPRAGSQQEEGTRHHSLEPRAGPGQLAPSQQHSQELRGQLVWAQAKHLEQYRALLCEPTVQQGSKPAPGALQDLGYETCGRSENEADREETPSPECEEPDVFGKAGLMEEPGLRGGPGWGRPGEVTALQQHVRELQAQLQNSNQALQWLQRRTPSCSSTSDYASGAEWLRKPAPGATDEDKGWQSDGHGASCPPALQASRDLQRLVHRVALLEAQLPGLPQGLRAASWPGKYDSLIQAQARELSHLRQQMREGRGVCHLLAQHLRDSVKSFEELLRGPDVDYHMGQSFRERLAQGSQLAERLRAKLSSRERPDVEEESGHESVALRLSRELAEKEQLIETLRAKLQERCQTPCSSRALSESPRSASSASFLSDSSGACSDGDLASESSQPQGPPSHLTDVATRPAALAPGLSPTTAPQQAPSESSRGNPPASSQMRTGLHSDSLSQALSVPLAPAPGQAFLPPAPLGCCGGPVFSLAQAQQELHLLQKQLGESGPLAASPVKPAPLPSDFGAAGASARCLHVPQLRPLHSAAPLDRRAGGALGPVWAQPHMGPPGGLTSPTLTGADLLEGHLAEIRSLRQRLEESICTNDRLRQQLESRLATPARGTGSPTNIYVPGLEAAPPLSSETQALREENQRLQLQLAHLCRELERLREAEEEKRALAKELAVQRQSERRLQEERLALEQNNHRLAGAVPLLEQQCEETQRLCQALCTELRVRETLSGCSHVAPSGGGGDGQGDPEPLLAEVRALRRQLLRGIQVNSALRQQLTRQQPDESSAPPFVAAQAAPDWQPQDSSPSPPVRDAGMSCPAALPPPTHPRTELPVPEPLARRSTPAPAPNTPRGSAATEGRGRGRVPGRGGDSCALKQQLPEGKALLHQTASVLQPALARPGPAPRGAEEQARQDQAWQDEVRALRARVAEQEGLLRRAAERLQRAHRRQDSMELFIVSHLTQTHAVLSKARTNLEKNKPQGPSARSPTAGTGESPAQPLGPIPAWPEPGRKRSRPAPLRWQEEESWPGFVQLPSA